MHVFDTFYLRIKSVIYRFTPANHYKSIFPEKLLIEILF